MVGGGRSKIRNMMWMKTMDKRLIQLMPVEDIGEYASETIRMFWSQKKGPSLWEADLYPNELLI
jgi:hypothetical protein